VGQGRSYKGRNRKPAEDKYFCPLQAEKVEGIEDI